MEKNLYWQPWDEPGLEHLHVTQAHEGVVASGLILRYVDSVPLRIHYTIHCTPQWQVRTVAVYLLDHLLDHCSITASPPSCSKPMALGIGLMQAAHRLRPLTAVSTLIFRLHPLPTLCQFGAWG